MATSSTPARMARRRRRTDLSAASAAKSSSKLLLPPDRRPPLDDHIGKIVKDIKEKYDIVGREWELRKAIAAKMANRHILLEGDVGTGKTTLASAIASYFDQTIERVDGDDRYSAAKLVGHFDPPVVIEKGYSWESFIAGPLVNAMKHGSVLFLNELNRMPEGTQNVLLAAMDERVIQIPKLGKVEAKDGFYIIASMNPAEFVATTPLSEALRDRFVWLRLQYQNLEEEMEIVKIRANLDDERIARISTRIVRSTRDWPELRRGSSVRGAIDLAALIRQMNPDEPYDWLDASIMSLATKVEVEDGIEKKVEDVIKDIVVSVLESEDFL